MSDDKKKEKKRRPDIVEITPPGSMPEFSGDVHVASASGTTGLMPTPPRNRSELHSYQDLAPMEIPHLPEAEAD